MILGALDRRASKLEAIHPSSGTVIAKFAGAQAYSGVDISPANSLTFTAFGSAVTLISGLIGRLPIKLHQRRDDNQRDTLRDDPRYDLLHNAPNEETRADVFKSALTGHLCTWGNGYAEIVWERGRPVALQQLRPDYMDIRRVDGKIWYYHGSTPLTPSEILHVPYLSFTGYKGVSPVELHRETLALGIAAERFGAAFYGNGGWTGGYWKRPEGASAMSEDAEEAFLNRQERRLRGVDKAFRQSVAQEGMSWHEIGIPIKDAQYLEGRKFSVEEVARIFNLPPFILGEDKQGQSYKSLETKYRVILDFAILPWLVRWEQELNFKLLTRDERRRGLYFEFDIAAFLRGDAESRAAFYKQLSELGAITPNTICAKENLPSVGPAGDHAYIQINKAPLEQIAGLSTAQRLLLVAAESRRIEPRALLAEPGAESRAERSLASRYRLRDAFRRLLELNAGRLVAAEVNAIRRELEKLPAQGETAFRLWLERFFERHEEFAREVMAPILRAYGEAIAGEAATELDRDLEDFRAEIDTFLDTYADTFAKRHAGSGRNQIEALLREADNLDLASEAIGLRLDEWGQNTASKVGMREGTKLLGAVSRTVYALAGVTALAWSWPGGKCDWGICPELNGRTVEIEKSFAGPGDTIAGQEVQQIMHHPPAHRGCTCGVVPVT